MDTTKSNAWIDVLESGLAKNGLHVRYDQERSTAQIYFVASLDINTYDAGLLLRKLEGAIPKGRISLGEEIVEGKLDFNVEIKRIHDGFYFIHVSAPAKVLFEEDSHGKGMDKDIETMKTIRDIVTSEIEKQRAQNLGKKRQ